MATHSRTIPLQHKQIRELTSMKTSTPPGRPHPSLPPSAQTKSPPSPPHAPPYHHHAIASIIALTITPWFHGTTTTTHRFDLHTQISPRPSISNHHQSHHLATTTLFTPSLPTSHHHHHEQPRLQHRQHHCHAHSLPPPPSPHIPGCRT